jgi:hypothetical protein
MKTTVILNEDQAVELQNCMKYYKQIFKLISSGVFDLKLGRFTVDIDKDGNIRTIKIETNTTFPV